MRAQTKYGRLAARSPRSHLSALAAKFALLFVVACLGFSASAATRLQFDAKTGQWVKSNVLPSWENTRSPARRVVAFGEGLRKGSILIDTEKRALFHVLGKGQAMKYSIGVGREGYTWKGSQRISRKEEWPSWTPPTEMRAREAAKGNPLPRRMAGGPENPLGARALYLGNTLFRIHGTNQPMTIGRAESSGCIRMDNDDVIHLFDRVRIGTRVVVR